MSFHWQFGVVESGASAGVTAGITASIVSDDGDGDLQGVSSNNFNDGEVLQVQYSGSGGSSVAYTFARGSSVMDVGTLSDGPAGGRQSMQVIAWKGNANPASGSDVTLSGTGSSNSNVHTTVEETGTIYVMIKANYGADFSLVISQNVDSGTATASDTSITVLDNT
tara:strand:+ start:308 stop:805 length:498 start_codon:yes stop_codon:yes gene_type:complete